jgi:hypothetical protein
MLTVAYNETSMKTRKLCSIASLCIMTSVVSPAIFSQTSEDLKGRWEGVHYYGDTTRLYDGTMIVRASTIDSMKMILTIDYLKEGKFTGKVHEHFYSDPTGSYFKANVSGIIEDEKIHFTSFEVKENKLPAGNRWCKPKATGVMVKKEKLFSLHMSFESTLTCTVGPAILERKVSENIISAEPTPAQPASEKKEVIIQEVKSPFVNIDSSIIAEKFKARKRFGNTTFTVQSDSIKINFFDNGTVDGDSISVFINGKLEVAHVLLSTSMFSINVQFEKDNDEIEVAMFAENLGSLPPNTALMQIVDGKKIHQAHLSSDTTSNAVIRIRRVK